ncbi:uncharacterized protein LOC111132688 [Crassostrea virginica]
MYPYHIQQWNQALVSVLTPSIIVFIAFMLIGVAGNATVLLVYRKHKMSGNGRFFIPVLATVDLVGSTAIAFDRYRRICQIGRKQWTRRQKWIIVTLIVAIAVVCNGPIIATSGVVAVPENNHTIQGATCAVSNHMYPTFEHVYSIISGFSALVTFIAVTIFNINIAYVVCTKLRLSIKRMPATAVTAENVTTSPSRSEDPIEKDQTAPSTQTVSDQEANTSSSTTSPGVNFKVKENISANSVASKLKKRCPQKHIRGLPKESECESPEKDSNRNVNSGRTRFLREVYRNQSASIQVMFLVMFLVMLVAYLPPLAFTLLSYNQWELNVLWISQERDAIVNLYFQVRNCNLLSNVANPYIYSLFDRKFRSVLFKCVKCS